MFTSSRKKTAFVAAGLIVVGLLISSPPDDTVLARAAIDTSVKGPRSVALAELSYMHNGEPESVDLYYPSEGPDAPPVIILPSGLTGGPQHHVGHAQHLASWGFAAAVLHRTPFVDGTDAWINADRASAALDAVIDADEVAGRLTDRAAVIGTHFNGMSAISASVRDPRFKVVVGLHPALFPYGSDAVDATVPTLVLGGNIEGGLLCTYGVTWKVMYMHTGSPHKAEFLFPDARPSDFQEPAWDGPMNVCGKPRTEPFPWIRGMLTSWLAYYVQGRTEFYDVLYSKDGKPLLPDEAADSIADNAPQRFRAAPSGNNNVELTWRSVFTDTTTVQDFVLKISRAGTPFSELAVLPLDATSHVVADLDQGVEYRFTLAYRDRAGHHFQESEPAMVVGGAPTPTPTSTRRPTITPTPTSTNPPTATVTPVPSPTATEAVVKPRVYMPRLDKP